MAKEILACIANEDIKYLHSGQISKHIFPMERNEAHEKNISHLIVRLFAVSKNNGAYKFLIQKRSSNKTGFPNYFTDSASGHVTFKNNLTLNDIKKEVIRELEEEFGISANSIDKLIFYDLNAEKHKENTEVAYIFIGLINKDVILKPDPIELDVNHSRFYNRTELIALLKNEKYIDYSKNIWDTLTKIDLNKFFSQTNKNSGSKKPKDQTALLIGRFQPLHHGHIYILRSMLKKYPNIKIGIGSSQAKNTFSNPFSGEERIQFIKSALKVRNIPLDRVKIYEIPDIFNANKWVEHVVSLVGEFDIVYANSDWVRQLFNNKGYMLGKKTGIFKKKYNGSNIRKLINKNKKEWSRLVPKEVSDLIIKFNGIDRIKNYYKNEKIT
jgi:nicotinamide-nucleotide adenylyltransferase